MRTRSRMTGATVVLVLWMSGALAACGSAEEGDTDTSSSSSAPEESTDGSTEDPADESGSGDKPSREDVIAGYTKAVGGGTTNGETDAVIEQVATCLVDEIYDDVSAQTLQAFADGDLQGLNPDDATAFGDASGACASAGS